MRSSSALYIDSATIAIVGQGGMKELKRASGGNYGIFSISSSKVHLENLKIMNGYVSIHINVSVHHVCLTNACDSCCGWCVGRFVESKYKDFNGRQKICGMLNGFDCCCGWCVGRFVVCKYKDLKGRQKICGMLTLVWF